MGHIPNQQHDCNTQTQTEPKKVLVIKGALRLRTDTETMHKWAIQGWAFIRTPDGIRAFYADVMEGSA
jgi:hypothetical protein